VLEPQAAAAAVARPPAPAGDGRVAVIVCHGMGQQVAFETLDCLAETLRRAAGDPDREVRVEVARLAQLATRTGTPSVPVDLRRAQIDLSRPGGGVQRTDLYEAYWAPITEGQVSLRDVFWFLLGAGWRGLVAALLSRRFDRWMFGGWVDFDVPLLTPVKLLGIIVLLLSLAAINAVLAGVVAARLLGAAGKWPGPDLFRVLTSDIAIASLGLVAVAAGIRLVPRALGFLGHAIASRLAWGVIYVGFAAIAWAGLACAWHIARSQLNWPLSMTWPGAAVFGLSGVWYRLDIGLIWGLPVAAAAIARRYLIHYVGDVVAYISAHTASRFADIRKRIQEVSLRVGSTVFHAVGDDGATPLYTSVVVVGHSLGSVIAYDMLNSLITQDRLDGHPARVLERTAQFLTFGSPLNKTAYIFRTQRGKGSEVRETMAAAIQPLITHYANRTIPWVNIYSRNDWIGGRLQYYDTNPPDPSRKVDNREDLEARTPLAAHSEHWENAMLSDALRDAILGPARAAGARG